MSRRATSTEIARAAALDPTTGAVVTTTASNASGGYTLGLNAGTYKVRFSKAGFTTRYTDAALTFGTAPDATTAHGVPPTCAGHYL